MRGRLFSLPVQVILANDPQNMVALYNNTCTMYTLCIKYTPLHRNLQNQCTVEVFLGMMRFFPEKKTAKKTYHFSPKN